MRVTLIHNPSAGSTEHTESQELSELLRRAGHEVRYQSCRQEAWEAVLELPADAVAVAGGDGTVARVAKAMAGRGVPVAPLPAGTANNIGRALGLAELPYEEIARGWESGRRVKLDIATARGPWGERPIIEGLGVGLFTEAIPEIDRSRAVNGMPHADAKVSYSLQMLRELLQRYEPFGLDARMDGKDVSGTFLLFEAMIMPLVGPNLYLAPDARMGDGCFELVVATPSERERVARYLESWQDGKARLPVLPTLRGKRLRIEKCGARVHLDDELWPSETDGGRAGGPIELVMQGDSVELVVPQAARDAAALT